MQSSRSDLESLHFSPTAPGEALSQSNFGKMLTSNPSHDISQKKLNEYLFKMVRYRHMDFELARFIMAKAILSPKQLYQHTKRSKQIKNQWHRDDPCITAVNIFVLVICALVINIVSSSSYNPLHILFEWLITSFVFVFLHFLAYGAIIAACTKLIAEKYLRKEESISMHSPQGGHTVEPMYSFDIHCNGFIPVVLFNYVGNVSKSLALISLKSDTFDGFWHAQVVGLHLQYAIYNGISFKWSLCSKHVILFLSDFQRLFYSSFHNKASQVPDTYSGYMLTYGPLHDC